MKKWETPSMEMLAINETAHGIFGCAEDGGYVGCNPGHKIPVSVNISIGPITIGKGDNGDNGGCGNKEDELS